jgi:formylglycine-generating enzyme required for sulfatase activity
MASIKGFIPVILCLFVTSCSSYLPVPVNQSEKTAVLHERNCRRFHKEPGEPADFWLAEADRLYEQSPSAGTNIRLFGILMVASSAVLLTGNGEEALLLAEKALVLDDTEGLRVLGLEWYDELETHLLGRALISYRERGKDLYRLYESGDINGYLDGIRSFCTFLQGERFGRFGSGIYNSQRKRGWPLLRQGESLPLFEPMVYIRGGSCLMGNPEPERRIVLFNFYISTAEVSQIQYLSIMGYNNSFKEQKPWYPVEEVSWYEAAVFCNLYSTRSGLEPCYNTTDGSCDPSKNGYRLPTEAEWEYAARGGIKSRGYLWPGSDSPKRVAWYDQNSGQTTHRLKSLKPNELDLHDMGGNVWEWCQDWFGPYSEEDTFYPVGPAEGTEKVRRGGSWSSPAQNCTVTARSWFTPITGYGNTGFRLARTAINPPHLLPDDSTP